MQRYHAASCTGAVNNSVIGSSVRDTARGDSSSLSANFSHNSRRSHQLTPYKLKCEKEPLNSRLGPPDFHPQTPNCPEETLTKEYVQSGYRETVEGLEEAREISLSQVPAFNKPVVLKCKEAIRKRHRAINESRAQKRKAGQVYGVPLTGSLLTKPGIFPDQKPCGEDFRKKWIEGLSQQHKRLRSLADYVPHGYRKKSLFEVLIRNNVPLLRATWFIKITYLNQARPGSAGVPSAASDKTQSRTELWTKDVTEYLQTLLDEFLSRNNLRSVQHSRGRLVHMAYTGSITNRDPALTVVENEEPSLHFKWWYMVRLLQWHQAEGLLLPSLIIDWVLNQLQEREILEILQLLLPIIYGVLETVVLSQTYIRTLVGIAVRYIREPSPGGSDLVDNSRRAYTVSAVVEMLRYLILAVPDTFVALDCFPLPQCVISPVVNEVSFAIKACDDTEMKSSLADVTSRYKGLDARYPSLSFVNVVSSIQKHADNLAKASCPSFSGPSVAKAVYALDKTLVLGDVREAYRYLSEDLFDGAIGQSWIAEVSPCLRSVLKWIGTVSLSFVCSVFFLCEWATCNYRDFRIAPPDDIKFTGCKDFSEVYIAIRLLKLMMKGSPILSRCKNESSSGVNGLAKGHNRKSFGQSRIGNAFGVVTNSKNVDGVSGDRKDTFESPGPLHDIIVCWIDQHEVCKGESFERIQLLILELARSAIFYPHVYVRQLLVSGIMDMNGPLVDLDRRKRHHKILKQLPGDFVQDALEEAKIAQGSQLLEVMYIYSNERRFVLNGLLDRRNNNLKNITASAQKLKHRTASKRSSTSLASLELREPSQSSSKAVPIKTIKNEVDIEEIKCSISVLLQLPNSLMFAGTVSDESPGSIKRPSGSDCNKMDVVETTPACEECRRNKKQKLVEERSAFVQPCSPSLSDDEDNWWARKCPKPMETFKADPPLKPTKQASRSRQKSVRRTQSLAQLAASRIEGSLGASTSHVCDNKVSCPHHRSGTAGETPKSSDGTKTTHGGDIITVGKSLKRLRYVEKRSITIWLIDLVKQLIEEWERSVAKAGQVRHPYNPDEKNSTRWKLGEDELSAILYLMDVSNDLVSSVRFLLWLLPKVYSSPGSSIHSGRNVLMIQKNLENYAGEVAESFLLSSLRRYENILAAADLVPEALSASMCRATAVMTSNGRFSGSSVLSYARRLLKKYNHMASVMEWEKNFKATCDKRLLSEFESLRSLDGELGFPLGVPAGIEDLDDFLRQKINGGRLSRVGAAMRDIVQKRVEEVLRNSLNKDRKHFSAGMLKGPVDKWDDSYQISQQIIMGLMDCMRQTGGAAQEGDPSLVSSAVSAIVNNVGPAIAKMPDLGVLNNYSSGPSTTGSLNLARHILRIHMNCLCLLKEALGERQSRVFEIALATEATSALAGVLAPGKASRSQFQLSPDAHDSNANISNDTSSSSAKAVLSKGTKIAAAVSALVIGAITHGVTSLERMVTVFRLREGVDVIHFIRSTRSSSNGNGRSFVGYKVENSVEVYVHWFRVLVGNCRTVCDGILVELLGEPAILALTRMQRMLPINLVLPPAYSIFAFVLWKSFILNTNAGTCEDIHQLYQSVTTAISDAIKHQPFRDICLRESQGFYDLVATDSTDADFAAMLELNGSDLHLKSRAFVPLRGRLFLDAIIDCKMPFSKDDSSWTSGISGSNLQYPETEKLLDKLVHVLDNLQPAKFHWQWVELRLLLNEQALVEKLEMRDTSLSDAIRSSYAIRSSSSSPDKAAASENENNFIQIILTRLLVRPDAAPFFSEVVHLFGRSLEDSVLLQARWFLAGHDVLFGRKSIRQRLINIAESKGLSTKTQFWRPWGWTTSSLDPLTNRGDKKAEVPSLEEGEVVEEGVVSKKDGKESAQISATESLNVYKQHITERALVELLIPCIDQSSDDSRNNFASELIKQLDKIEQQINAVARGSSKQGAIAPGNEGPATKGNNRKGIRGSSPGLARRHTGNSDSAPSSPPALRASMSLRLQLLMRLLPVICTEGEPSHRNMRHVLAAVILRLLGNRIVHEDADLLYNSIQSSLTQRDIESMTESSSVITALSSGSLFNRLLFVLHGLLGSWQPSWLRLKLTSKSNNDSSKNFSAIDREVAENLQNDLDQMQLPDVIRRRIQAAMPVIIPRVRWSISCSLPSVTFSALASLQPRISNPGHSLGNSNLQQKSSVPSARSVVNLPGKSKSLPLQQDTDLEVDPWIFLEDGAGAGPSSSNSTGVGSGDHANLRASSWLRGAVRVRRTDLTYIGAVDEDS